MVFKLLEQSVIPPEKMKTHAWISFWNTMSTEFAKKDSDKPLWKYRRYPWRHL